MENDLEGLRAALVGSSNRRGRVRTTAAMRERLRAYIDERCRAGATERDIALELGVSVSSVQRWMRSDEAVKPKMVPVRVRDSEHALATLRARGGCGVVIEGLDVASAAELLRRLS